MALDIHIYIQITSKYSLTNNNMFISSGAGCRFKIQMFGSKASKMSFWRKNTTQNH